MPFAPSPPLHGNVSAPSLVRQSSVMNNCPCGGHHADCATSNVGSARSSLSAPENYQPSIHWWTTRSEKKNETKIATIHRKGEWGASNFISNHRSWFLHWPQFSGRVTTETLRSIRQGHNNNRPGPVGWLPFAFFLWPSRRMIHYLCERNYRPKVLSEHHFFVILSWSASSLLTQLVAMGF